MDEIEQKFLATIAANPDDAEARSVYADWLDQQGDLRGEYLRLEALMHVVPARLAQLSGVLDPAWLSAISRQCDVVMIQAGDLKINVIKVTREVTGLGLKDAKDLVEAAWPRTPQIIKAGLTYDEGRAVAAKFTEVGAYVRVVPHGARVDGAAVPGSPNPNGGACRVVIQRIAEGSQIMAIKAIREVTRLGLKEAKDMSDAVIRGQPMIVADGVSEARAEQIAGVFQGAADLLIER